MTPLTTDDVHCAIETLDTSYTFDPPKRWLEAYDSLQALREEITQQLKPYAWIKLLFLALGLATFVWLVVRTFLDPIGHFHMVDNALLNAVIFTTVWSMPGGVIAFGAWLTLKAAARRHPLVLFKHRISIATKRFHALAREARSENANAIT